MRPLLTLSLVLALGQATVRAQSLPAPANLPSTAQAQAWIDADPAVLQARSALAAAEHAAAAVARSPYEWSARVQAQRRDYRDSGARSSEWTAQLERPIRINGKTALDRSLGEVDLEIARARVGENRHEVARSLSDLWFDVQAATGQQALVEEQLAFAQRSLDAVERRRRAGDASVLDVNIARGDLAEVQRQASLAATQLAKARARLQVRFPQAQPPAGPLPDPVPPEGTEAQWRERILEEADPLKIAQGQLRRAELAAERARADRVADPTVGIYTASEALRNERVVGVSVTIPLGGEYRSQRMQQALREAEAAGAAVERERLELATEVAETYAEAQGAVQRWRAAEQAAQATRATAQLTQRAYTVGEFDVQGLLLARRQALESSRAALEARVDALRWNARLLIDAHRIWDLAED